MGRAADVVILAGNNPYLSRAIRQRDGGDRPGGNALVSGGRHFVFGGQVDPQLDHLQLAAAAGEGLRVELFVQDPGASRHPLHVAWANHPATAGGVTMFYLSGVDDGDGFESAMRMLTDAAFIAARREGVRPGIVEQ